MIAKRLAVVVTILLLAVFALLKEHKEPYVWLFVDDLLHPKPAPITQHLNDYLAVRLYADSRPHIGKIARLQKGLVLVVEGKERIEEGFGFGLPLVLVDGDAYMSRTASVQHVGATWIKRFEMDTLDTPSGFLRRKYEPVSSIGEVIITYLPMREGIRIVADFTGLRVRWDLAYLMNEQGALFFTRYEEPGLVVDGREFGKWEPTTAKRGCVVANDGSVRFCVETEEEVHRYYGRERYNQYYWVGMYVLSWAGIDLEVEPTAQVFDYFIAVEGR